MTSLLSTQAILCRRKPTLLWTRPRLLSKKPEKRRKRCVSTPTFTHPRFFRNSKIDWEEFLTCRDYVQTYEMMIYREVRIIWTAFSGEGLFTFCTKMNKECVVNVPDGRPVPQPYFDAPMPELVTRNDGVRVVYVNPNVAEIVAARDQIWKERAESIERHRKKREERKWKGERKKQEEEEKEPKGTETKEADAAQIDKDTPDESTNEIEGKMVEKPVGLDASTHPCSPTALDASQEPCAPIQEKEAVQVVDSDREEEMDAQEVESALEDLTTTRDETETTEEVETEQDDQKQGRERPT